VGSDKARDLNKIGEQEPADGKEGGGAQQSKEIWFNARAQAGKTER
jgi:hypothetical protein